LDHFPTFIDWEEIQYPFATTYQPVESDENKNIKLAVATGERVFDG
jgi:hypothetical protein